MSTAPTPRTAGGIDTEPGRRQRPGGLARLPLPAGCVAAARSHVLGRVDRTALVATGPVLFVVVVVLADFVNEQWLLAGWPLVLGYCFAVASASLVRAGGRSPSPSRSNGGTGQSTSRRRFARHFVEMVLAMCAGMLALDPVYAAVASRAGYDDPWVELPVVSALVMTLNMTGPMVLLMLRHGHGRAAVLEMAGSMVVPTAAATGLHLCSVIPASIVMTVAHVSMLPAMLLVMFRRYREYA